MVASRQSLDADWFTHAEFRSRGLFSELMAFSELTNGVLYDCCGLGLPGRSVPTVMVFMFLVLPGRSVPPQVDSDKLRNELHS